MLKIELPQKLQQEFERAAKSFYSTDGVHQALIEAVELWLFQHQQSKVEEEAATNDSAFEKLALDLEKNYAGKWVVIAEGKLQGTGNSLTEVEAFAPNAKDRVVMLVGLRRPKTVEVGWQMAFN